MPSITVNGLETAYERRGKGVPLVLLHGILQDSRSWHRQLDALSDAFDVIVPDLPGCGQSADPPDRYRFPEYGRWLAEFLTALGIAGAHVGGLSWGGILALELYSQHPDLVRSLVLADTYAGWKGSLPAETVQERLDQCLRESEMAASEFIPTWLPGLLTPEAPRSLRDEVAELMTDFHPAGYRTMAISVAEADLRDVLSTVRVPVLLIWGTEDRRSPLSVAWAFRDAIPEARLVEIPGSGHLTNIEAPDVFNAAVRSFATE